MAVPVAAMPPGKLTVCHTCCAQAQPGMWLNSLTCMHPLHGSCPGRCGTAVQSALSVLQCMQACWCNTGLCPAPLSTLQPAKAVTVPPQVVGARLLPPFTQMLLPADWLHGQQACGATGHEGCS